MADSLRKLYAALPQSAQAAVVRWAGYRAARKRFGPRFERALATLRRLDRAGAEAVRSDQDRRLRDMVRWAARTVPHYRDQFRREGIDPESVRGVADLSSLPTVDKATVRRVGERLQSDAVPRRARSRGHTSGTTGTSLALWHTPDALAWEYAAAWRQREWFGLARGDYFAAFGGQMIVPFAQDRPPFWRDDPGRGRMLFSLYHMKPEYLDAYVSELKKPGYRFWQGYPSSIALVCQHLSGRGETLGEAAPHAVATSSETLLDSQRAVIEAVTGAPVADRYAHSELAVSVAQCPAGRYHVDTECCVVEIDAHAETDRTVTGEILATGLTNRAMPLIRYRTGDVATVAKIPTDNPCPCGRSRPLLERVDGRIEDYVLTPDGRRVGRMDHVFKDAHAVAEAQIYQPSLDRIVVRLVAEPQFDAAARHKLHGDLTARLGSELSIEYELVDAIPRQSNGKFRAVISDLAAGRLA